MGMSSSGSNVEVASSAATNAKGTSESLGLPVKESASSGAKTSWTGDKLPRPPPPQNRLRSKKPSLIGLRGTGSNRSQDHYHSKAQALHNCNTVGPQSLRLLIAMPLCTGVQAMNCHGHCQQADLLTANAHTSSGSRGPEVPATQLRHTKHVDVSLRRGTSCLSTRWLPGALLH